MSGSEIGPIGSARESPFRFEVMTREQIRVLGGMIYQAASSLRVGFYNRDADAKRSPELRARRAAQLQTVEGFIGSFVQDLTSYLAGDPDERVPFYLETIYSDEPREASAMIHSSDGLLGPADEEGRRSGGISRDNMARVLRALVDLDLRDAGWRHGYSSVPDSALAAHSRFAEMGALTAEQIQWVKDETDNQ